MNEQKNVFNIKGLPKYSSSRTKGALEISTIINLIPDGGAILHFDSEYNIKPLMVSYEYMEKYKPFIGGMYIVYEDGYESFCPTDKFLEFHKLIVDDSDKAIPSSAANLLQDTEEYIEKLQRELKMKSVEIMDHVRKWQFYEQAIKNMTTFK